MRLKEKFVNCLGTFGMILYYFITLFSTAMFPLAIIELNFFVTFIFIALSMFFPPSAIVFWIWGLVATINGPQDAIAIIYYVVFAVVIVPLLIYSFEFLVGLATALFIRSRKRKEKCETDELENGESKAKLFFKDKGNLKYLLIGLGVGVAVSVVIYVVTNLSSFTYVYITKTGAKYHRSDCDSLSKSKIRITLEDAKDEGYKPCSKCDPPTQEKKKKKEKKKAKASSSEDSSSYYVYYDTTSEIALPYFPNQNSGKSRVEFNPSGATVSWNIDPDLFFNSDE